jgi:hypothetical protein
VAWSVGSYSVENGTKKIYALICSPSAGGPFPVVIYNHGGLGANNGGNINGAIDSGGQPQPVTPTNLPNSLAQCIDWAKRGWVFATSSYRGESIIISSATKNLPHGTWVSDGQPELCLGEVTDVMALTDLVVNHASSISVGNVGAPVPLKTNGKVLMYGYSHGGCVTYRAVEQGAPVTAFAVIEGFTDFLLTYLNAVHYQMFINPAHLSYQAAAFVAAADSVDPTPLNGGIYYPDATGVMGYNWRSPHYFAARGDLSIDKFKTMPMLIFHGDVDYYTNPLLPAGSNPVYLDQATEMANRIGAASMFVGPMGSSPPASEPCMTGPVGAPLPNGLTQPTGSCAITFVPMDTGDSCLTMTPGTPPFSPGCAKIPLLMTPPHTRYLAVYNKMDHINGGLAIKNTFDGFVTTNFSLPTGCNGLEACK